MVNRNTIRKNLHKIGLSPEEATIYVHLLEHGLQTALTTSRATGTNRTTLYRILEALEKNGLIYRELTGSSTRFRAAEPERLQDLLTAQENQLATARDALSESMETLRMLTEQSRNPTTVRYFRGRTGLRQILFHTLDAKDDVLGLGYADWNDGIGRKYAEILRGEYVSRRIHAREILNEGQIDEQYSFTNHREFVRSYYRHRIIPESVLPIRHDTYIYNDIFAFYHIWQEELFGVEIENTEIARTQKAIFELLWKSAGQPDAS